SGLDNGARYSVVITNAAGMATSRDAVLTVVPRSGPTATILTPADGTTYTGGAVVKFSGSGVDGSDNPLPASAYSWSLRFPVHHGADEQVRPVTSFTGLKSGQFTVPVTGETATDVWYRITLTVTDSQGHTDTKYRDVLPVVRTITLQTSPPGLEVDLDGQP